MVCDALGAGRQTILLRKGGIHEGREGFSFAHQSFFLFPTRFHALSDQVREGEVVTMPEWQAGDALEVNFQAELTWAVTLNDWDRVAALEPLHIYSQQTVRDRFDWEGKGMASGSIHVALVRVHRLDAPWKFPYEPRYAGCRSWLNLPMPPSGWADRASPVIDEAAFAALVTSLS